MDCYLMAQNGPGCPLRPINSPAANLCRWPQQLYSWLELRGRQLDLARSTVLPSAGSYRRKVLMPPACPARLIDAWQAIGPGGGSSGPFCCWSCGAGGSSGPFCCWVDLESTGARLPASSPCTSDRPAVQAIDRCAARRWCRNQRASRGRGGGSGSRGGGRYSRRGGICSRGGGGRYSRGGGCRGSREGGSRGGG